MIFSCQPIIRLYDIPNNSFENEDDNNESEEESEESGDDDNDDATQEVAEDVEPVQGIKLLVVQWLTACFLKYL